MISLTFRKRPAYSNRDFELDVRKREVRRGGRKFALQHKTLQVLQLLMSASPRTVSRSEFIEQIWDGNYLTGEKGVTQALWSIRTALGDNARHPRFIETVTRQGYKWIAPRAVRNERAWRWPVSWQSLAALPVLIVAAGLMGLPVKDDQAARATSVVAPDGKGRAYFRGRDIIVTDADQRTYLMRPRGSKSFGIPTYSPDGERLAFTASTKTKCELIVVEFATGNYEKFTPCPGRT